MIKHVINFLIGALLIVALIASIALLGAFGAVLVSFTVWVLKIFH